MTNADTTATREAWLRAAVEVFRPRFVEIGYPLPEQVRVSVGFGSTGARQENQTVLGVTYKRAVTEDNVNEVFISPEDADTASMLETLLHELIHVADDCESAHRGAFAEMATRLGFEGPMTHTPASIELQAELLTIADALGEYPGAKMTLPSRKTAQVPVGPDGKPVKVHSGAAPQTNRMLKVTCTEPECPAAGYVARVSRKWLEVGAPRCPMGHEMH